MGKMLKPLDPEVCTYHYFLVTLLNPDKPDSIQGRYRFVIYSYIDDIQIISAIVKHCTKYDFSITEVDKYSYHCLFQQSIDQACEELHRFRFTRTRKVKLSKVVTWEEEISEEL